MTDFEFYHTSGKKIKITDLPDLNKSDQEDAFALAWKMGAFIDAINYIGDPKTSYSAKEFL